MEKLSVRNEYPPIWKKLSKAYLDLVAQVAEKGFEFQANAQDITNLEHFNFMKNCLLQAITVLKLQRTRTK